MTHLARFAARLLALLLLFSQAQADCGPQLAAAAQRTVSLDNDALSAEAKAGDAMAQNELGRRYGLGHKGLARDPEQSFRWHAQSAGQGFCDAQTNLAFMHLNGEGTSKDVAQAKYWYGKAADQGNARAQYTLGYIAVMGLDGDKDGVTAERWLLLAANQGYLSAQQALVTLYSDGKLVPARPAEAVTWLHRVRDAKLYGRVWTLETGEAR